MDHYLDSFENKSLQLFVMKEELRGKWRQHSSSFDEVKDLEDGPITFEAAGVLK